MLILNKNTTEKKVITFTASSITTNAFLSTVRRSDFKRNPIDTLNAAF